MIWPLKWPKSRVWNIVGKGGRGSRMRESARFSYVRPKAEEEKRIGIERARGF